MILMTAIIVNQPGKSINALEICSYRDRSDGYDQTGREPGVFSISEIKNKYLTVAVPLTHVILYPLCKNSLR